MMKILRNRLFIFMMTAIVFSSVGAIAATKINANQIYYTNSNNEEVTVDSALNDLYTTQATTMTDLQNEINQFNTLKFNLFINNNSNSAEAYSLLQFNQIPNCYKTFKVVDLIEDSNVKNCYIEGYSNTDTGVMAINKGEIYTTSKNSTGKRISDLRLNLLNNTNAFGRCHAVIEFYKD